MSINAPRGRVFLSVLMAIVRPEADPSPRQDHGFMYGRSFEDPDGHIWEAMWMDVEAAKAAHEPAAA